MCLTQETTNSLRAEVSQSLPPNWGLQNRWMGGRVGDGRMDGWTDGRESQYNVMMKDYSVRLPKFQCWHYPFAGVTLGKLFNVSVPLVPWPFHL